MDGLRVGALARPLAPLASDDTLARAAELLRSVPFDRVPVVDCGRLVGVVSARTLGEAARAMTTGGALPEELRLLPVAEGAISEAHAIPADASLEDAVAALRMHGTSLPVVGADGAYLGMVDEADLASLLLQSSRPASIGGMATPLGVYLTTGAFSAGARGSLGLVLTGASLGSIFILAAVVLGLVVHGAERATGFPIRASMLSVPAQWLDLNPYDVWAHALPIVGLCLFALLFRWLPLTGYHAAEHQVVHAIEQDRPLTVESVARMPRVHPRCGTRFFAVGVLFTLFGTGLPVSDASVRYAVAVIAILVWWRRLGDALQSHVTTRCASERQIGSAISAAEELLAKHRRWQGHRPSLPARIWHMGILQVAAGGYLAGGLLTQAAEHLGLPLLMP